jgi:ATP-binding cassette subfamily B protein
MHNRYQEIQGAFADLTEIVRERFAGIRIIKAYNREKEAVLKLEEMSKDYVGKNLKLARITQTFFPMMLLFSNLSLGIVLYLGGRQTIYTTITSGDFVAFISYIGLLTWPMMAMGWVVNLIQRGKASLDRINKILETRPEIDSTPDARPIMRTRGEIVFEDVIFSYESGSCESDYKSGILPALAGINIKLEPGKTLGVIGPPGSGKTTLLSLIPRLFEVSQGSIRLDGIDIHKIQLNDLRSKISFMPQEPFLFGGTIRENITFNNKKVKEPELIKASEEASLYETIKSFPKGFETIVGEKGVVLSGGQKQRIALARSLLKDTPILIMDDPISQVDLKTGAAIIKTIRSMAGEKTIIIVSHRLSAVRFADFIITLDTGRIVESDTHAKLMEHGQYYAKTFRLQEIEEEFNAF